MATLLFLLYALTYNGHTPFSYAIHIFLLKKNFSKKFSLSKFIMTVWVYFFLSNNCQKTYIAGKCLVVFFKVALKKFFQKILMSRIWDNKKSIDL